MATTSCLYTRKELLKMSFNKTDLVSCKILKMLYRDFAEFSIFCFVHFQKRIANRETRYVNSNPVVFYV